MESLTTFAGRTETVALATLGEVLSAFTTIQESSGRTRVQRVGDERLPWRGSIPTAAMECEAPQAPKVPERPVSEPVAAVPAKSQAASRRKRRVCQCGNCSTCKDNARWERIFQEKFADPEYYLQPLHIRYSSPLSRA
jgi:hypothetical protein